MAQRLAGVKELRLLIGNTTNRKTLEQRAEGYRRLDLVAKAAEAEAYPKRTETKRMAGETAGKCPSPVGRVRVASGSPQSGVGDIPPASLHLGFFALEPARVFCVVELNAPGARPWRR